VLTYVAIALGIAACAVAVRWTINREDALGRVRKFPTISVAVLLVLAVVATIPGYLRHKEEGRLSAVASQLAGRAVQVHCQTYGQSFVDAGAELGYVPYDAAGVPEAHTLIKHDQCDDLSSYMNSDKANPPMAQVVAVHVLTHESMHMAGETVEAKAECEAMQRDAETARLLGATSAEALTLARTYWVNVYPHMNDTYRTGDCAAGGTLDEHLPDAPWGTG
jgi:hypothetical protein